MVVRKFLNPKGSLFLNAFKETSHLILAAIMASYLSSLKYHRPEFITCLLMGAKYYTTFSLFINVLCCIMVLRVLGGSPLIHRSNPVSLFMKTLCALAHLVWFLEKDKNA
jgi:hypothetical protein